MDYSKDTLDAHRTRPPGDAAMAFSTAAAGSKARAPPAASRRCACQHYTCTCDHDPRRSERLALVGHPDLYFVDTPALEQRLAEYGVASCSHIRLAVSVESRVFTQSVLLIRYFNGLGEELFNLDDLSRLLCRCHGQQCFAQSTISFRKFVSRLIKPRYRTSWSVLRNHVGRFGDAFWELSAKYVDHYGFLFIVMTSSRPESETIRQYLLEGVRRSGEFLNLARQQCQPQSAVAWLRQRCLQLEHRCHIYEQMVGPHATAGGAVWERCRVDDQPRLQ